MKECCWLPAKSPLFSYLLCSWGEKKLLRSTSLHKIKFRRGSSDTGEMGMQDAGVLFCYGSRKWEGGWWDFAMALRGGVRWGMGEARF